jgi:hypothetical protein
MPAKWQQWMPFRIDAFKGSPAVQAMHPCARIGYLYLLACAWQTDDCTLSCDPLELAEQSGLGDELWAVHGPRILRKFGWTDDRERLRNDVLFDEWKEAKRIFDARRQAADRTNSTRSPHGHRDGEVSAPSRSADTRTGTGTETGTEGQKPSRAKAARGKKTEAAKSRHAEFKAAILRYWESKNPGVEMPWGPAEGRNLEMWLRETPNTTLEQFVGYLRNRFKSAVTHTERPSRWIGNVTNFAGGPIDKYGKPLQENSHVGSEKNQQSPAKQRIDGARRVLAEIAIERGLYDPACADGRPDAQVPQPGPAGEYR